MFNFDTTRMQKALRGKAEEVQQSARPVAQAGAQILYEQVRVNVPVKSGTLKGAIYQVFSHDFSGDGLATYHISWNKKKAPHGHLIEGGTSRTPAKPFLRSAQSQAADRALAEMNEKLGEVMNA